MPRPVDQSRARYYVMQGSMWVILAAALGVAALASRITGTGVALGEPIDLQSVSVRTPARWTPFDRSPDSLLVAERPGSPGSRILIVEEHEAGFIERLFTPRQPSDSAPRSRRSRNEQTVPMGPITGTLTITRQLTPISFEDGQIEFGAGRIVITVAGELDASRSLTITLQTPATDEQADPDDVELVKRIAASVTRIDDAAPQLRSR